MRRLLHSHPIAVAAVLFFVVMAIFRYAVTTGVHSFGWWIAIPILIGLFLIAWYYDRKDQRGGSDANAG